MSKLKAKDPKDAAPCKPKILIFGKPGVGKTWQALDFPSVYYIDCEGGANLSHYTDKLKKAGGAYMGPEDGANDFPTVIEQFKALSTEKHKFRTVVVDSFSKLFNTAIATEAERLEVEGIKNEFARDKKPAIAMTRQLIRWADRCDMNVIFIAHAKPEWGIDAKGQRSEIGTTFDGYDKMEFELHLALEILKQGPARKARVRKSRLTGFPDGELFDWSYPKFAERYGKDIIEKESTPITLATPEQVSEINRLLSVVKIDPEDMAKILGKAGAETVAELNSEQAASTITWLNKKITN